MANHAYFNLGKSHARAHVCLLLAPSLLGLGPSHCKQTADWKLFAAGHDAGAQGLYQHTVSINGDHYLPTNDHQIPLGEKADVGGSVFDLRISKKLADQLPNCPGGNNNGYDHNFCINGNPNEFRFVFKFLWNVCKLSLFSGLLVGSNMNKVVELLSAFQTSQACNFTLVCIRYCFCKERKL